MLALKIAIVGIGSVLILAASLPSLQARWPHAAPRTLAFLLVLAVAASNAGDGLRDPLSPAQLVSWLLLAASIPLAIYPLVLLRVHGRPRGNIDYTMRLVDRGIYRLIRHPLYLSLILVAVGSFLKRMTPVSTTLALAATTLLYLTARLEERFSATKFGAAYREYVSRTKMFIPWIL